MARLSHDLPFDLYRLDVHKKLNLLSKLGGYPLLRGSCTTFDTDRMLFCFDSLDTRACHTSDDLFDFQKADDTLYTHEYIEIASSDG